ncbi:MAG: RNA polymerase sigma factor [Clostridiales bacterium]|nr:RNA polymerase sigma factor [Clostridiales bacterium]
MFSIVLAALNDDDQDFVEKLYTENASKMYAYALNILHNQNEAEKAVSNAMYKIIKHIDKFQGENTDEIRNKILICLKTIVKNASKDVYNQNKEILTHENKFYHTSEDNDDENFIEVEDVSFDLEDTVFTKEDYRIVKEAIMQLPTHMKDTVNLVYAEGFSCYEAANFLGITESAVKARLFKARAKIKEMLGDDFNDWNEK